MSRIADVFANLAERQETALVAYLTAGYPSLDETMGLLAAAVEGGADIVELGVPFSDPMGDGPVIQQTTDAALRAGTTTAQVVELVAAARDEGIEVPIALMGYLNPFLHYGPKRLCVDAVAAGVDGLIVPDLPAHQADEWLPPARASGLDAIFFGAPGSRTDRLRYITERTTGFLYCLATDGVTGARDDLDPREALRRMRVLGTVAADLGVALLHENCQGWAGQSAWHTLDMLHATDQDNLRLVFDLGNGLAYGYETVPFLKAVLPWGGPCPRQGRSTPPRRRCGVRLPRRGHSRRLDLPPAPRNLGLPGLVQPRAPRPPHPPPRRARRSGSTRGWLPCLRAPLPRPPRRGAGRRRSAPWLTYRLP
ncbi:MAG: tryptophan synthase subunit alpha [Acidimicrobiales bacterium]